MTLSTSTFTGGIGIGKCLCGASDPTMFSCSVAGSGSACCSRQWGLSVSPKDRDPFAKSVAVAVALAKDGGASIHPMVTTDGRTTGGPLPGTLVASCPKGHTRPCRQVQTLDWHMKVLAMVWAASCQTSWLQVAPLAQCVGGSVVGGFWAMVGMMACEKPSWGSFCH